ncbi:hypothetical protein NC653_037711 [Populus alba x Populus x berolinensis]|uniref:Uncharacterized protein n=1 Tax=Populus alba x Populus x berolinensis TaxID=444605 RepID=A0AAD6PT89_9ROSI|nr:hypothetical protein NC653_037711 [Populus alba x Populus x berolinensis]
MRTRNSIDTPRPSPPEDPSQGNYYTHWTDFHHLLKPANGLSGKATNSLGGDLETSGCSENLLLWEFWRVANLTVQGNNKRYKLLTTSLKWPQPRDPSTASLMLMQKIADLEELDMARVWNMEVAGVEKRREVPEVVEIDKLPSYSEKMVERAGEMADWSY